MHPLTGTKVDAIYQGFSKRFDKHDQLLIIRGFLLRIVNSLENPLDLSMLHKFFLLTS